MARNQNKLLTGTIIVIDSEKEVSVVKITGNIKENIQKSSEVTPLDGATTEFFFQGLLDVHLSSNHLRE